MTAPERAPKSRWEELCQRVSKAAATQHFAAIQRLYDDLAQRYSEPHRYYHTLPHIEFMLDHLSEIEREVENLTTVEFAIWYHDAVYDPQRNDNEERSALLFQEAARHLKLPDDLTQQTARAILATKHHQAVTREEAVLIDLDLLILGQPRALFDNYERAIYREYDFVDPQIRAAKRTSILTAFLRRPSIFHTEQFFKTYEQQARENLAYSLEKLKNQLN